MIEYVITAMWGIALLLPLSLVVLIWKLSFYVHNKDQRQTRLSVESAHTEVDSRWLLVKTKEDIVKYLGGSDWRGPYTHQVNPDGSLTVSIVSEYGLIPVDSYAAGTWINAGCCFGIYSDVDSETDVSTAGPSVDDNDPVMW